MNFLYSKKSGKLPVKIFLSNIIAVVVTSLVLSASLYVQFENYMLKQIFNSEKTSLAQASYSAKIMTESAKTLALQLYFDTYITKLRLFQNIADEDKRLAYDKLNNYSVSVPFIHSIYIYNAKLDTYYILNKQSSVVIKGNAQTSSSFYDQGVVDIIKNYKEHKYFTPIPRAIPILYDSDKIDYSNGYTFLFYDGQSNSAPVENAIIINISETWMRDTISSLYENSDNSTFIIDKNGMMVTTDAGNKIMADISSKEYIKKIMTAGKTSGYFVDDVEGTKSLVMYVSYSPFDWTFIRTVPYNDVTGKIHDMSKNTIIWASVILFLGILASILMSRKLQKPINNILSKLKSLEAEKRSNIDTLKQGFLKKTISGETQLEMDRVAFNFQNFNINLDFDRQLIIILMTIDNYTDFCNSNNLSDRSLLKFAVSNIACELGSENFRGEAVDMGEMHIALVLTPLAPETFTSCRQVGSLVQEIQAASEDYMKLSLSFTISSIIQDTNDLPYIYSQVLKASHHRIYQGYKTVIFAEDLSDRKDTDSSYSTHKEKSLIGELIAGNIDNVKIIFNEIIESSIGMSYTSFQYMLIHLSFSLNSAIEVIQKNNNLLISFNFSAFTSQLNNMDTLEQVSEHFVNLFDLIASQINEKKLSKHDELVARVMDIIQREFTDPTLSFENIAESVGMSSAYLGRLFRKTTTQSVVDYINHVRMEKAVELLGKTEQPISDIASNIGYTSSQYFYKVFKKTFGVTPNNYRQNLLSQRL